MKYIIALSIILIHLACNESFTPKPKGWVKISLPEKKYQQFDSECPFTFKIPVYSEITDLQKECFSNLQFPQFNATLHLSYFPINNNLMEHTEQSRELAYKHTVKANAISEQPYLDFKHKVFGLLYDYDGTTATALQFYLTDSTHHFFRGALYFDTEVNDSILPISIFLQEDIKYLIESFRWKNTPDAPQQAVPIQPQTDALQQIKQE